MNTTHSYHIPFKLSEDEVNLILNYRDCISIFRQNILDRASKLAIESTQYLTPSNCDTLDQDIMNRLSKLSDTCQAEFMRLRANYKNKSLDCRHMDLLTLEAMELSATHMDRTASD